MLDKIEIILNSDFNENLILRTDHAANTFDLHEDGRNAKCKIARFQYIEGEVLAYKFDKQQVGKDNTIFPFFANGVTHLKKMCDFILFYKNKRQQIFVLLCNLKSDDIGTHKEQIAAAEVFVEFVTKTSTRLFPTEKMDYRLIKVLYQSNKSVNKNTTNGRNSKNNMLNNTEPTDTYYFHSNGESVSTCNLAKICRNETK